MVIAMISNSVTAIPAMTPGPITLFDVDCLLIISVYRYYKIICDLANDSYEFHSNIVIYLHAY